MVHEPQPGRAVRSSAGRIRARLVFTVLGIAGLLVGAILNWEAGLAGNKLTLRSLVQNDFTTRSDVLRTVGAASAVIAIVALLGLLDRTGWLTKLAGFAAVVLFVLFAVQVFRHYGENFGTAYHALRPGAWCQLGAGVLLLLGGLIRYRRRSARPAMATKTAPEFSDYGNSTINENKRDENKINESTSDIGNDDRVGDEEVRAEEVRAEEVRADEEDREEVREPEPVKAERS